jgi:CBS-domain-containing membrane protein
MRAHQIMTRQVITVATGAAVLEAANIMLQNHISGLPVVDEAGKLVGIVTRTNLLSAVAGLARDVPDPTADDDHIRNHIIVSIDKADWAPFGLGVIVLNGVVHLSGVITNENARQAAVVAAENVSGVKKVHDHLCWVEPMSGMYLNSQEDENLLKAN